MHFLNPEDLPEGIKRAIMQHLDQHNMSREVAVHEIHSFLDSLKADQLESLDNMIHTISNSPETAAYFAGLVTMTLKLKHNICPCGSDQCPNSVLGSTAPRGSQPEEHKVDMTRGRFDELLSEYGLEEYENSNGKVNGLYCKNCGMIYQSLEDRMLRPPGVKGCAGCQAKAKWG